MQLKRTFKMTIEYVLKDLKNTFFQFSQIGNLQATNGFLVIPLCRLVEEKWKSPTAVDAHKIGEFLSGFPCV